MSLPDARDYGGDAPHLPTALEQRGRQQAFLQSAKGRAPTENIPNCRWKWRPNSKLEKIEHPDGSVTYCRILTEQEEATAKAAFDSLRNTPHDPPTDDWPEYGEGDLP